MPHKSVQTPRRHTDRQCTGISTHFPDRSHSRGNQDKSQPRGKRSLPISTYLLFFLFTTLTRVRRAQKGASANPGTNPNFGNATKWYFTIFCFKRQAFRCFLSLKRLYFLPPVRHRRSCSWGKRRSLPLLPHVPAPSSGLRRAVSRR